MIRELKRKLAQARERFWKRRRQRRAAKPGGKRRKRLARLQEFWDRRSDRLARRLRRARAQQPHWNGHEPVLGAMGARVVAKANEIGLIVTSTTGGAHAPGSYHYQDRAIDFGVDWSTGVSEAERRIRLVELHLWLAHEYPGAREVFGPASFYIKNGARVPGAFPDHGDHVHFAF